MASYIFVISRDKDTSDEGTLTADEILEQWVHRGRWPLNQSTRHQAALREGDKVLFYVSGQTDPKSSHFTACGEVAGPRLPSEDRSQSTKSWIGLAASPLYDVPIRNVVMFENAVPLRPLIPNLKFIRKKESWGSYFHGGVVRIDSDDFDTVTSVAGHSPRDGR